MLVIVIIFLFIGVAVAPSIAVDISENHKREDKPNHVILDI